MVDSYENDYNGAPNTNLKNGREFYKDGKLFKIV
jgi:hypothetical protein